MLNPNAVLIGSAQMQRGEPMSDLISRQAAIDALGERPMVWVGSDYGLGVRNQYDADVPVWMCVSRKTALAMFKLIFTNRASMPPISHCLPLPFSTKKLCICMSEIFRIGMFFQSMYQPVPKHTL